MSKVDVKVVLLGQHDVSYPFNLWLALCCLWKISGWQNLPSRALLAWEVQIQRNRSKLVDVFFWAEQCLQTVGAAFGAKKVDVRGTSITLGIWDTAGAGASISRISFIRLWPQQVCLFVNRKIRINEPHLLSVGTCCSCLLWLFLFAVMLCTHSLRSNQQCKLCESTVLGRRVANKREELPNLHCWNKT